MIRHLPGSQVTVRDLCAKPAKPPVPCPRVHVPVYLAMGPQLPKPSGTWLAFVKSQRPKASFHRSLWTWGTQT